MSAAPPPSPAPDPHESPFFRWLAERILRHRLLFGLGLLALFGLFGAAARNIRIDNSIEAFLAHDSEAREILERLRDDFGHDDVFLLLVEGDVFTADYITRIKALEAAVRDLSLDLPTLGERARDRIARRKAEREGADTAPTPAAPAPPPDDFGFVDTPTAAPAWTPGEGSIVEDTISIASVRDTRWVDDGLRVDGLFDTLPDSPAAWAAVRARALSNPTLVGQVLSRDGRYSVLIVRTDFMSEEDSAKVHAAIVALADVHEAPGFRVEVGGGPALGAEVNRLMLEDLAVMFSLAMLFVMGLMAFQFRHALGVVGPMAVVVAALGSTYGLMALTHTPMTMVTNVLPAFLICASIGDAIHIQSVYRDQRKHGLDNHAAIVKALALTGVPCVFTSLTTFAGLYSFRTADLEAVQDMGVYGAWGVLFALLFSLVLLPIILSFNTRSLLGHRADRPPHHKDRLDRLLDRCDHLSAHPRKRATLLAVVAALLLVSVWGGLQLRVHHDPVKWLPADAEARVAIEHMNEHLAGTSNIELLIHAKPGKDLRDRDTLVRLEQLERHIRDYVHTDGRRIVGNATSILDVVREGWKAFHGSNPAFYRVPDTDQGVSDMLTTFESRGPRELARLATVDLRTAVMTIRVAQVDAWSYLPLTEHIERGIATYVGDTFQVEPTGTIYNLFTVVSSLLDNLLSSFGWAFVIISVMLIVLLRSLGLGLLAMVPNLLPIANILGFMGLTGIPIDVGTLLIASVALGIAVDDTIHFFHQYRVNLKMTGDVEWAIDHAYAHSGRAMVSTSVVLIGGFLVYTASQMVNLQRFGLLVGLTVLFALVYDIIVAPALLRLAHRRRATPTPA